MRIRIMLSACALVVLPMTARAVTLATSAVFASGTQILVCTLTNVGSKDAKIKAVEGRGLNGGPVDPFFQSCQATLAPGATCTGSFSAGVDGWCFFDVRGKVRASIGVYDGGGGGPTMALPATAR